MIKILKFLWRPFSIFDDERFWMKWMIFFQSLSCFLMLFEIAEDEVYRSYYINIIIIDTFLSGYFLYKLGRTWVPKPLPKPATPINKSVRPIRFRQLVEDGGNHEAIFLPPRKIYSRDEISELISIKYIEDCGLPRSGNHFGCQWFYEESELVWVSIEVSKQGNKSS